MAFAFLKFNMEVKSDNFRLVFNHISIYFQIFNLFFKLLQQNLLIWKQKWWNWNVQFFTWPLFSVKIDDLIVKILNNSVIFHFSEKFIDINLIQNHVMSIFANFQPSKELNFWDMTCFLALNKTIFFDFVIWKRLEEWRINIWIGNTLFI